MDVHRLTFFCFLRNMRPIYPITASSTQNTAAYINIILNICRIVKLFSIEKYLIAAQLSFIFMGIVADAVKIDIHNVSLGILVIALFFGKSIVF